MADIVKWETEFATDVCMSYKNYVSEIYVKKVVSAK
jgi:hypothetical protein